ncbi:hypothetical protein RvY_09429 [Ramazzottius varieornatus]|uniref:Uncharacterized protein n=1 Tax=Ramazzottius varieornatus TaxID=947166 RepID=A0A1D1VET5_RAMVA|nr:hypothetical protein RvY_09429 [Ramazzottius varieornatus]
MKYLQKVRITHEERNMVSTGNNGSQGHIIPHGHDVEERKACKVHGSMNFKVGTPPVKSSVYCRSLLRPFREVRQKGGRITQVWEIASGASGDTLTKWM